jgi:hypothetical protein
MVKHTGLWETSKTVTVIVTHITTSFPQCGTVIVPLWTHPFQIYLSFLNSAEL